MRPCAAQAARLSSRRRRRSHSAGVLTRKPRAQILLRASVQICHPCRAFPLMRHVAREVRDSPTVPELLLHVTVGGQERGPRPRHEQGSAKAAAVSGGRHYDRSPQRSCWRVRWGLGAMLIGTRSSDALPPANLRYSGDVLGVDLPRTARCAKWNGD